VEFVVLRGAGVVVIVVVVRSGVVVGAGVVVFVMDMGAGVLVVVITGVDVVAGDVVEVVVIVSFSARARAWCKRAKPSE
jgi:hypothetical protein